MAQLSVLLGFAVAALQAVTRLSIVIWSFRADRDGRRHALRLLAALPFAALTGRRQHPGPEDGF